MDYSKRKKQWNIKTRLDDKRGYKEWTDEAKLKVRSSSTRHPLLNTESWLKEQYIGLGKTTEEIAKEVGCVSSTVFFALKRFNIPRRSRKEACKSGPNHHLWRGGSGFRSDTKYCEWRTMVYGRDNYTCRKCGVRGVYFQAHHILPCRDFPDLIYIVDNGITLCEPCHRETFNCELQWAPYFKSLVQKEPNSVKPNVIETMAIPSQAPKGCVCRDYGVPSKEMI